MAAVDKIYLNKEQTIDFLKWVDSVDTDFKAKFPNADSLWCYLYWGSIEEVEEAYKERPDIQHMPVSNFPLMVDRWVYQHPTCPQCVKDYMLNNQYGGDEEDLLEPIPYEEDLSMYTPGTHVKITYSNWNYNKPISMFCVNSVQFPNDSAIRIYCDKYDTWIKFEENGSKYLGACDSYSVLYHGKDKPGIGSLKAMIRKIRSWKLPIGTTLRVLDWHYKIEIRMEITK